MTERLSNEQIEATLQQLAEAHLDLGRAQARLREYNERFARPQRPPLFEDLSQLITFYGRVQDYEEELAYRQAGVHHQENLYSEAADTVRRFLPDESALIYVYRGERDDLRDARHVIKNQHRRIIVQRQHQTPS